MRMEVEKKFMHNYLSLKKYSYGKLAGLFVLTLCTVMSLLYWDKTNQVSNLLSANQNSITESREYWRLFTTTLIHGDLKHLLSNSLMLYILTYFVTAFYGGGVSIIWSLIMGMLTNFIVISQYENGLTSLVGASGVIFYLWGFWLVLYVFIQRHMSLMNRLLRVGAVFMILLIPTSYSPQTSYMAHYVGFLIGVVNGVLYFTLFHKKLLSFESWQYKIIEDVDFDYSEDSTELK
jgi:rhomboid protease GluP